MQEVNRYGEFMGWVPGPNHTLPHISFKWDNGVASQRMLQRTLMFNDSIARSSMTRYSILSYSVLR